ncbi:MAG: TrkA family potassium uptake protein [Phycisphaeraceae bacterium]|nr:MAG: TrkA family potassium uptake protein [Phycisphaeraceae bacterium]
MPQDSSGPVAVIGLGQFGKGLAVSLAARGVEVIAIDRSRSIVEDLRDDVTLAVAFDATDEDALRANLPQNLSAAVVGIGNNFEATLLVTVLLKQHGVGRVIARAASPLAARILAKIGADEVVNPEEESADRWANRIRTPNLLSHIEFHEGYSIVELGVPRAWVGKTLIELNLRAKAGLHVVAVKRVRPAHHGSVPAGATVRSGEPEARIEVPLPTEPLRDSDVLILMGKDEDFARIEA